jgi:hypothetical protein
MLWLKACLMAIACGAAAFLRADDAVKLAPRNEPSAVFGDSEATFSYGVKPKGHFNGTLTWRHAAVQRTIARGEISVAEADEIAIRLKLPPVREAVAVETTLTVDLQPRGGGETVASHSRRVWIFPQDPFVGRTHWLKSLEIKLFDPKGTTRDAFNALSIPMQEIHHATALAQVESGVVIIGEDVSWRDYRALGDILPLVAAKGVLVLCLAPADGAFVLPGTRDAEPPPPRSISLFREDLIARYDKRLDASCWNSRGELIARRMNITSDRRLITVKVAEDEAGWPWLELEYSSHGKWIVCAFGVIAHWEASPNPRFFLAALLEQFSHLRGDKE